MSKPASTLAVIRAPIVNSDGTASRDFTKKLQEWESKLSYTINQLGQITPNTQVQGRTDGIGTTLQNIDSTGIVTASGVDFARNYTNKVLDNIADGTAYARVVITALTANKVDFAKSGVINKTTDNLTDGIGNPLAGGKTAYAAMVASAPTSGQTLRFNGTNWLPVAIAQTAASTAHQWLNSYNATTGAFTQSQPAFADISGTATASQVPALSALTGQITTGQLPASGLSVTITTAKLTTGGTNGSMTFTNGILTAQTPAT